MEPSPPNIAALIIGAGMAGLTAAAELQRAGRRVRVPTKEGIRLALVDRPEDLRVRPFATGGFFQFWGRCRKSLAAKFSGKRFPATANSD